MSYEPAGKRSSEDDPLLDVEEAAARAGMAASSWRSAASRGYVEPPDDPDEAAPKQRRRPRWRQSTVDRSVGGRLGRGRRTDLAEAKRILSQRLADELAAPTPASTTAMREWLHLNHQAILAVADVLVDHRDTLLAGLSETQQRDLAGAIDQAGEAISSRPSRLLASAVTYAQFLLRPGGPARTPVEVREVLTTHSHLHLEFNRLRGREGTG